jgi:flagellar motor protein MotB
MIAARQHIDLKPQALRISAWRDVLQRECGYVSHASSSSECEECGKKKQVLQRKSTGRNEIFKVPAIVHEVVRSPGQPLDPATREFFQPRFGLDLSGVQIHADARGAESARSVHALAYTVGRDIVFGEGQYVPASGSGRRLIAHELAHVAQQGAVRWTGGFLPIGAPDSHHEREADRTAITMSVEMPSPLSAATLQRQPTGSGPGMAEEAGALFLRVDENGRIEILARPPALPGVGNVGAGFRCEGGRCQPVGSTDPSDLGNRTYTPQEALELLRGQQPDASTPGGNCPADRRVTGLGLCCPVGMFWDAQRFACAPTTPNVCLPAQMTPLGGCCPTGERWNYLHSRCEVAATGSTVPALPPLTVPPVSPAFRFGTIESATFDDFRTDDATVPAKHSAALDHLASLLNIYPGVEVHIEGHTDSTADDRHNLGLSIRRAQAVRDALADRNVNDPGRLAVEGFGEARLRVTPEGGAADRASNRRVEVWFYLPPAERSGPQLRLSP